MVVGLLSIWKRNQHFTTFQRIFRKFCLLDTDMGQIQTVLVETRLAESKGAKLASEFSGLVTRFFGKPDQLEVPRLPCSVLPIFELMFRVCKLMRRMFPHMYSMIF